jgi:aldose 1-epimerase
MNMKRMSPVCAVAAVAMLGAMAGGAEAKTKVSKQEFGKTKDGHAVQIYTLTGSKGLEARIMTYGGIIVSLKTPDKHGKLGDVVLGFDSLAGYQQDPPPPYFGALIGRYGNRIAKGTFQLEGKKYNVPVNNGPNALHGGLLGFDKRVWTAKEIDGGLELHYLSKDGEEGYPGNLSTTVRYTVSDDNELKIEYSATTDKPTVVNLTNHSYFNLAGQGEGLVLNHMVTINADKFTPVDAGLIPTGELRPVAGTPFDFRTPFPIGARIDAHEEQIKLGGGYDHNHVLNKAATGLTKAATVTEPKSGRVMEVSTDQPGLQFYTGNFLDGSLTGKGGKTYARRSGFCMETQHFPDSPNHASFPSTELKPGQTYHTVTVFKFSAK